MVYITRKEHFNAAHRLYNESWTEEKNAEVFGPCANANFHGHNFDLFVTVKGEPDPDTGFVINAKDLSKIIRAEICDRYDHKNLNLDVDDFKGMQPSTENFVQVIWRRLEPLIKQGQLHSIRLIETENIYAEYFGES
jgi:6-pyruvoyltetrahydropterin/6-carboxytetrahydropterin synthase